MNWNLLNSFHQYKCATQQQPNRHPVAGYTYFLNIKYTAPSKKKKLTKYFA
jgi:hypothetical protein